MNTRKEPSYDRIRARKTIDFCDIISGSKVLDIGAKNLLSQQLALEKDVTIINTSSDLDVKITPDRNGWYHYVTCFEVFEHLLNPRLFLENLYKETEDDVVVYLSTPSRPQFLWGDEHWSEYDRVRLDYIFEKTGFKIVEEKKIYVPCVPYGIRPLIRNFIPQTVIYKIVKT